jgi:hypothetical protein
MVPQQDQIASFKLFWENCAVVTVGCRLSANFIPSTSLLPKVSHQSVDDLYSAQEGLIVLAFHEITLGTWPDRRCPEVKTIEEPGCCVTCRFVRHGTDR